MISNPDQMFGNKVESFAMSYITCNACHGIIPVPMKKSINQNIPLGGGVRDKIVKGLEQIVLLEHKLKYCPAGGIVKPKSLFPNKG